MRTLTFSSYTIFYPTAYEGVVWHCQSANTDIIFQEKNETIQNVTSTFIPN